MRPLHLIMPMAGEGTRFLNQGFSTPKPLILCGGKTLFQRALSSFDRMLCPKKYSFIVRKEHIDRFYIDELIREQFPEAMIFSVPRTTRSILGITSRELAVARLWAGRACFDLTEGLKMDGGAW